MLKLIEGSEDSKFMHPLYEASERDFMGAKAVFTIPTARTAGVFPGASACLGVGVEEPGRPRVYAILSEENTRDLYEKMGRFLAQDAAPVKDDEEDDTEDLSLEHETYPDVVGDELEVDDLGDRVHFYTPGGCADLDADQVRDLVKRLSAWLAGQDTDD